MAVSALKDMRALMSDLRRAPARRKARLACAATLFTTLAATGAHAEDRTLPLHGEGVQIYTCSASSQGASWHFVAPEATLTDMAGTRVGTHGAGPAWHSVDGSTVIGTPIVSSPAPGQGAVPWLLLRVRSRAGNGMFANIAYVARTDTKGGVAPATGCDAAHVGTQIRVPYSATYVLFPGPLPPS